MTRYRPLQRFVTVTLDQDGQSCRCLEQTVLILTVAGPRTQRYQQVDSAGLALDEISTVWPSDRLGIGLEDSHEAAADIEIPSAIRSAADLIGSFARWA